MARQHSSKDTRERIISAAVEKFMEKGYSKTTLEDIVQHVGLTRGAFYWNFESKKDILDEIVARYQQFYRSIYSSYRHFDSARDTLRDFLLVNLRSKNTMNPYVMIIRYKVEASQEVSNLTERQTEMDKTFWRPSAKRWPAASSSRCSAPTSRRKCWRWCSTPTCWASNPTTRRTTSMPRENSCPTKRSWNMWIF